MITWLVAILTVGHCPVGWYVATVRPSGVYTCAPIPAVDVCNTQRGCDRPVDDRRLIGVVLCAVPVWINPNTVGCAS